MSLFPSSWPLRRHGKQIANPPAARQVTSASTTASPPVTPVVWTNQRAAERSTDELLGIFNGLLHRRPLSVTDRRAMGTTGALGIARTVAFLNTGAVDPVDALGLFKTYGEFLRHAARRPDAVPDDVDAQIRVVAGVLGERLGGAYTNAALEPQAFEKLAEHAAETAYALSIPGQRSLSSGQKDVWTL
jgi:hypothetical protein